MLLSEMTRAAMVTRRLFAFMVLGLLSTSASAQAVTGLTIGDLSAKDLETAAKSGSCATGYRRAYFLRDTPADAPLVFIDRANSALIKLDGQTVELKSVAHLARDKDRTRSFMSSDQSLTVEQTFKTTQYKSHGKTLTRLDGTIKVISKTQTVNLRVVGTPGC